MRHITGSSMAVMISIIIGSYFSSAQEIPEIAGEELPGYTVNRNDCYDGGSLWGYMNGGADIYLEYGFDVLRVEELTNEEETIKLEIYRMSDPYAAFGIYSIKTYKCEQSRVIAETDCLNPFQYQLFYGTYYIQLINESGSDKAMQAMVSMADALTGKTGQTEFALPCRFLTDSLNIPRSKIKMVKGILGIQDKTPELSGYFEGMKGYQIYYAKTETDGAMVKYYEIIFTEPEMKNEFLAGNQGKSLRIRYEDKVVLVIYSL